MTANLSTIFNSGSLYEQLIDQVIQVESQPKLRLQLDRSRQKIYEGVLSDFNSRVSTLNARAEKFADPFRTPFESKTATVESGAGFTASATDDAASGEHSLRVDRLARADARLSQQFQASGSDLADVFSLQEKTLTMRFQQSDGSEVALDVAYTPEAGATNDDILTGLSSAIADAVETAISEGTLEEGTGATASVVRETSSTARLSIKSTATGYANRLQFSGDADLLQALQVDDTSVYSGTGGGAVYDVGTDETTSSLTAAFELDGLTMYRDSNTVSDALDGVSLKLQEASGEEATFSVGADTKGMRAEVDAFIKDYNALQSFLKTKTSVDPDAGTRGDFAGDSSMRSLRLGLRNDLSLSAGAAADGYSTLADLGIEAERDGTLRVTDPTALTEALSSSPAAVNALFGGEDSVSSRITGRLGDLLGSDGTIAARKDTTSERIRRIDDQVSRWDARLEARETSLRDEFARLQVILEQVQSQQESLVFYSF